MSPPGDAGSFSATQLGTDDLAFIGDQALMKLDICLGVCQFRRIHEREDAAQMLLAHGSADCAWRRADDRGRLLGK